MGRGYGVSTLGDTQNAAGHAAEHSSPPESGGTRESAEVSCRISSSGILRKSTFLLQTELLLTLCGAAQCNCQWERKEMREPERERAVLVGCHSLNTWGGSSSWRCCDMSASPHLRWILASSFPANWSDLLFSQFSSLLAYLHHPWHPFASFLVSPFFHHHFPLCHFTLRLFCMKEDLASKSWNLTTTYQSTLKWWVVLAGKMRGYICKLFNSNLKKKLKTAYGIYT